MIDNDGIHVLWERWAEARLSGGIHTIRVSYFQGPAPGLALVLAVAGPGEHWRIFDMNDFQPPPNPESWKYHRLGELDVLPSPDHRKLSDVLKEDTGNAPGR